MLFVAIVAAGLIGNQNPYRNIAPTAVWIVVWVGLAYVSAFVGNLWALINPWRTIFESVEWLHGRATGRRALSAGLRYPEALGVWPAVVLLLALAWVELVYPSPAVPAHLACLAVGYSALTFAGMALFGREAWLRNGEVFSVVFAAYARFAPTQARPGTPPQLILRPFGAGLRHDAPASWSMTAFVLLLLSTVLYDGLLNTPEWTILENAVAAVVGDLGEAGPLAIRTAGLLAFWLVFLGAYVAVSALMGAAMAGRYATGEIARRFAPTLIPIAIGYHLAHYLVFLLIQGQYIVPLISDPFGFGWNLFGTAGYRVDIAIVGARFAWYAAVAAVLTGHVVAVYLAHAVAVRSFEPRRAALRSQVPLTALMVIYTFISLSILAEPILERREPAQPAAVAAAGIPVPADALLPEPGSGRLQPVGPGKLAKAKLTYRVLGSAFHDGTRTGMADLVYAYVLAYRWGARGGADDTHYDPQVDAATAAWRRRIAGFRVLGSDATSRSIRIGDVNLVREVFTIEVYATPAPEHPERDGAVEPPWSTVPWHLIALMEEAVDRGWAAFSKAEAARKNVEWLDLVRSGPTNARLATLVERFEREAYRPAALEAFVTAAEARRRWAALAAFHKAHGHFLVTNGPYRLKRWSAGSVTLEAFRDFSYPLGVGSYDAYAVPRRGYITGFEQDKNRIKLSGDIEMVVKFARSHKIERQPIRSIPGDVLKRSAPQCRYMVVDGQGRAVLAGVADLAEDRTFQVDLGGRLPAGAYTLIAMLAVNDNVMNAEIRRFPVRISSNP
jgi:hypothetical protein